MLILITYDVNTEDCNGRRRLRKIAKKCQSKGQRVQNSVFECLLDNAEWMQLKSELLETIDFEHDSLRFYRLGNHYESKIEHFGAKNTYDPEDVLMI